MLFSRCTAAEEKLNWFHQSVAFLNGKKLGVSAKWVLIKLSQSLLVFAVRNDKSVKVHDKMSNIGLHQQHGQGQQRRKFKLLHKYKCIYNCFFDCFRLQSWSIFLRVPNFQCGVATLPQWNHPKPIYNIHQWLHNITFSRHLWLRNTQKSMEHYRKKYTLEHPGHFAHTNFAKLPKVLHEITSNVQKFNGTDFFSVGSRGHVTIFSCILPMKKIDNLQNGINRFRWNYLCSGFGNIPCHRAGQS